MRASYVFLARGEVKVWFTWEYINNYIKGKGRLVQSGAKEEKDGRKPLAKKSITRSGAEGGG